MRQEKTVPAFRTGQRSQISSAPSAPPTRDAGAIRTSRNTPTLQYSITPRGRIRGRGRRRGQPARRSLWSVGFKLRWLAKSGERSALCISQAPAKTFANFLRINAQEVAPASKVPRDRSPSRLALPILATKLRVDSFPCSAASAIC